MFGDCSIRDQLFSPDSGVWGARALVGLDSKAGWAGRMCRIGCLNGAGRSRDVEFIVMHGFNSIRVPFKCQVLPKVAFTFLGAGRGRVRLKANCKMHST